MSEAVIAVVATIDMIFDDEEDEEQEQEIVSYMLLPHEVERENHSKNKNYFELIIPSFSLTDFKCHFRMSRTTFERLSLILGQDLNTPQLNIPVMKKLAIAVWSFGNQEVHRSVADRFGVAKSTAWQCTLDVAKALCARALDYIQWPRGEAATQNEREFREMAGLPGVIGVVDGCHIQITAPHENPQSYMNRKGYYSINVQCISDAKMQFIDVYAGCCGSINDARVWELSDINQESNLHYDEYFPNQSHILGDKIYPNTFKLLTPYKDFGNLLEVQNYFNLIHARTRQIIERAFALLLCRFRKLKLLYLQNVQYASLIILACCILHNICLSFDDIIDIEDININNDNNDNDHDQGQFDEIDAPLLEVPPQEDQDIRFDPQIKRNIIANQLYINRRR